MRVGDTKTWERTFMEEDVVLFGRLSGDLGEHHIRPDEQGRLMVHGLLTATLATKLGGELNYIAREMSMEFVRPVFVGDTIICTSTITALEPARDYLKMSARWICRNQQHKEVLRGQTSGVIRDPRTIASYEG